ncbi:Divalent-cation tolerance protein CutA [uncultured archaeon]|nr:Divalent-cation tolerance protein CutA [uncultured archaeon]
MKTGCAVVLCTVPPSEAERTGKILVEERLAACVSMAGVRSCYIWEGKANLDREELLIIKTTGNMVEPLKKRILELHSYKVPEIIVLDIIEGHQPYLDWIFQSVG